MMFCALMDAPVMGLPGVYAGGSVSCTVESLTDSSNVIVTAATYPFISRADDDLPNQGFDPTLVSPGKFSRSIVNNGGFGELSVGYGDVELINAEADYDDLVEGFAVDGRRVVIKVGAKEGPRTVGAYNGFVTLADLQATGWVAQDDALRISLRDKGYLLEVPTQPNVFDGTGGLNGGADLTGKRKPIAVGDGASGDGANVSPVLILPEEYIYMVNDGSVQAIPKVYDSGFELDDTADYPTLAALRAATLVAGQYATCIAFGIFRLGGRPDGRVTCDVEGDNSDGYVETTADVIRFLVENAADVTAADFDDAAFDLFNTLQPAPIFYYLDHESNETLAETLGKLMGRMGWAGFTRLGMFEIARFDEPGIAPVAYFDQLDISSARIERQRLPSGIDPIVSRLRVTFGHNFTVMTNDEIVGDVLENQPNRAAFLQQPFRTVATADADALEIEADHRLAKQTEPFVLYFVDADDAQAEHDRLFALYGVERALYRFTVKGLLHWIDVGHTVHLTYPRWDLHDGRYGVVVEVDLDAPANETTLTVFV